MFGRPERAALSTGCNSVSNPGQGLSLIANQPTTGSTDDGNDVTVIGGGLLDLDLLVLG